MRAMIFGALMLIAPSAASADVTFLNCTLPDIKGKPMVWNLRLNEEAGTVQVSRGGSALNKVAIFRPKSISFQLFGATIDINRVDGTIKQTPTGKDGPRLAKGKCVVSDVRRAF